MSTPTQPMPRPEVRTEIHDFVAAVAAALDDLPADDVAELTDGLEADLADAWAAEGVTPVQRFGSPESYAAELRAAAGLPPRTEGARRPAAGDALRVRRDAVLARLRAQPWWPEATEYALELRPAWWALRGAVLLGGIGYVLLAVFGAVSWALLVVLLLPLSLVGAVLSMRRGAAGEAPTPRARRLLTLANVVAVLVLAFAALAVPASAGSPDVYYDESVGETDSLVSGADTVTNVFAYDAEGKPITRFRLYDQAGRPLQIGQYDREGWDDGTGTSWRSVPDSGAGPAERNLYPLLRGTQDENLDGEMVLGEVGPVAPPFAQLPALPPSTGAADDGK